MDFALSERVEEIKRTVRGFVEKEVLPIERNLRARGFAGVLPELREARRRAQQTGLWAAHIPEEHGGAGLSLLEFAHMKA